MFAPAGTPKPVVQRLNTEALALLKRGEVAERLLNSGVEAVGTTPGEFDTVVRAETKQLGAIIKDDGIQTNDAIGGGDRGGVASRKWRPAHS